MVTVTWGKDKEWLHIEVNAPFSGTRDALQAEGLLTHCQLCGGDDTKTLLNYPIDGILNHIVKMLIRVEQVAANCSDFGETCRNCGYAGECGDKIAGRE